MKKSLTQFAQKELQLIFRYSKKLNQFSGGKHVQELLKLMAEHVEEIRERYQKKDKHYLTETGDLLILCFALLKEAKVSPDVILSKCYKRYRKKLPQLIKEMKPSRKIATSKLPKNGLKRWGEAKKNVGVVNAVIELIKEGTPDNRRGKRKMKYRFKLSGRQHRASIRGEGQIERELLNKECLIVEKGKVIKKVCFKDNAQGIGARKKGNVIVDLFGLDDKGSPVCGEVKINANNPWSAVVQCAGQVALLRSDRKFLMDNIRNIANKNIRGTGAWGMVIAPSKYWKRKEFVQAKQLMKSLRDNTKVRICCVAYSKSLDQNQILLELIAGLPPYTR